MCVCALSDLFAVVVVVIRRACAVRLAYARVFVSIC